jgi:ribosome-binding protein aMBF1 (putative translation factor)
MDHQDWKPVVFNKKPDTKKKTASNSVPVTHLNSNNKYEGSGKKIVDDDGDVTKPATVGTAIGRQIAQARALKKISQKDLANQMNLPVQTIQTNENGKAVRNNALLARFEKVLGVKLNR